MKPAEILVACALAAQICVAQEPQAAPEFEVATVKPASPGARQGVWTNGSEDRIRMYNMSLRQLILFAYDQKSYQVTATGWADSDRYDVIGKVTEEQARLPWEQRYALMHAMTRSLLAGRFKLVLHREEKELGVYALVAAKNGSKIKETGPNPGENVRVDVRSGHLSAQSMPMSQLVEILSRSVDRPILDRTGILGVFDVTLDWGPEIAGPSSLETKPPLPIALQEQLGLKLETQKSKIEVLVIDRAERPSEN
jgi:uncharacterized protein (TIGR03435 family)